MHELNNKDILDYIMVKKYCQNKEVIKNIQFTGIHAQFKIVIHIIKQRGRINVRCLVVV